MQHVTFTKGGKFPLHTLTFAPNTNIPGVLDTFSPWDMILVFVDLIDHETAGELTLEIAPEKIDNWKKSAAAKPLAWFDPLGLPRVAEFQIDDEANNRRCTVYAKLKDLQTAQGFYTWDVQAVGNVHVSKRKSKRRK